MVKHTHREMGAVGVNGGDQIGEAEGGWHTHHGWGTSGAGRGTTDAGWGRDFMPRMTESDDVHQKEGEGRRRCGRWRWNGA